MIKFRLASVSVLAAYLSLAGCQNNEIKEIDNLAKENQVQNRQFPVRPNIAAGQSNWPSAGVENATSGIMATGLTTTDLDAIKLTDMVAALIKPGPDAPSITNVSFTGSNIAAGTFSGGTGIIGFEDGIVLSSGNIATVKGPNTMDNATTNRNDAGDADLDALNLGTTGDAAVLEFDFECQNTKAISFQYVFTSEEYNEYVNGKVNDVFAFFLNGENIALVPSTTSPVAINSINCGNPYNLSSGTNCSLFRNNDLSDGGGTINTEMDGLTVVLTATGVLKSGVNHIKLAIADVADKRFDSNVFLKGESFVCRAPEINVGLDIKPGSCPNPLNTTSKGVLPVAITGSSTFNIQDIDISTLKIGGVVPIKSSVEDVVSLFTRKENSCECTTKAGDGINDLVLHFDTQQIVAAMGTVNNRENKVLNLTGNLKDGTPIKGGDCVVIIKNK